MKFINNSCDFIICFLLFFSSCASEKKIAGYTTIDQKSSSQGKIYYGPYFDTPPSALNLEEIKVNMPPYPEEAKKLGIEGTVPLELWIDEKGRVRKVILIESLYPVLDSLAIEMVGQLRFSPAKKLYTPVAVRLFFPFTFTLEDW